MLRFRTAAVLGAALMAPLAAIPAFAQTATLDKSVTVTGQGSTFVSNFMEQCKADVKNEFGINVAYQGTGSGAGRAAYIAGTNDYVGSDVGFNATEATAANAKAPYVYLPIAIGGIAIIYKVPGVSGLKFSGPTLAKIFSGQILKWNAEDIAKDNPSAKLPDQVIKVVVRSDSSGTSNVFTDYLGTASKGAWKSGTNSNFPVPAGNGIAQRGSDGVSNYVAGSQGDYAITYAESSFAAERKLDVAKVINTAGEAVGPDAENVSEAMAAAAVNDDGTLFLNFVAASPKAYPISTTAYLIAPKSMDKAKGDVLRTFLTYAAGACQAKAVKVGYAPLPAKLQKLVMANIAQINPGSAPVPTAAGSAPTTAAVATTAAPTTAAPTTAAPTTAAPTTKKPATKKPATKVTKKTTKKK